MKRITLLTLIALLTSCAITKPREEVVYNYKDSTVVHHIDSIKIIPVEKVVDIVTSYDTLRLETSLAKAEAHVDTMTHTLKGKIENKQGYTQKTKIEYRDRIIRDTTKIKVPYEVEKEVVVKPKIYPFLLWYFIISILIIGLYVYFKIKR